MDSQNSVQIIEDVFRCYDMECDGKDILGVLHDYADCCGTDTVASLATIAVKARNPGARISDAVVANYIGRKGALCLRCKSDRVNCGQIEMDDAGVTQDCWCDECGLRWVDIYTLTGVEEEN